MLYTQKEMLEQWRLRHCLDASGLTGNADDRFDREESDLIDLAQLNDWYAEILERGDQSIVPPTDITSQLTLSSGLLPGEWVARLPDDVVNIVEVTIVAPPVSAEIIDPTSRLARLLTDEFAPVPTQKPIAFMQNRLLKLFIKQDNQVSLSVVKAIAAPPAGFYSITSKGLALIPKPDLIN